MIDSKLVRIFVDIWNRETNDGVGAEASYLTSCKYLTVLVFCIWK